MNLCEDGHDEICFTGHKCPLCEKVSELDREINELQDRLSQAQDEIDNLTSE